MAGCPAACRADCPGALREKCHRAAIELPGRRDPERSGGNFARQSARTGDCGCGAADSAGTGGAGTAKRSYLQCRADTRGNGSPIGIISVRLPAVTARDRTIVEKQNGPQENRRAVRYISGGIGSIEHFPQTRMNKWVAFPWSEKYRQKYRQKLFLPLNPLLSGTGFCRYTPLSFFPFVQADLTERSLPSVLQRFNTPLGRSMLRQRVPVAVPRRSRSTRVNKLLSKSRSQQGARGGGANYPPERRAPGAPGFDARRFAGVKGAARKCRPGPRAIALHFTRECIHLRQLH